MFDSDSVDCPAKAQRRKVRTTIFNVLYLGAFARWRKNILAVESE
jgi:hypothetical protein